MDDACHRVAAEVLWIPVAKQEHTCQGSGALTCTPLPRRRESTPSNKELVMAWPAPVRFGQHLIMAWPAPVRRVAAVVIPTVFRRSSCVVLI